MAGSWVFSLQIQGTNIKSLVSSHTSHQYDRQHPREQELETQVLCVFGCLARSNTLSSKEMQAFVSIKGIKGATVGASVGSVEGKAEGALEGISVMDALGVVEGASEGDDVGVSEKKSGTGGTHSFLASDGTPHKQYLERQHCPALHSSPP